MKRAFILSVLVLVSQALAAPRTWAEIKKAGVIRIANDGNYAPFYIGSTGNMKGFEIDLGNEIFKRLGLKTTWIKDDFDSLLANMTQGKYEIVMSSITINPQRQKIVDFSSPEYCSGLVFVTKKGTNNDLNALKNERVGVLASSLEEQFAKNNHFTKIKRYDDAASSKSGLTFGGDKALLLDQIVALEWAESDAGKKLNLEVGQPLTADRVAIALPKNNPELKSAINSTLAKIIADGTYEKISQKWLPRSLKCK